jgi:hypothetical protein
MLCRKLKIKLFFLFFFIITVLCPAEEANGGFWGGVARSASFGKPFWADMCSTLIRAEVARATNSPDYDWGEFNTSERFYVFANLGADIPIWSDNFTDEKYGLSVTLPFMIELWYDRLEWVTSPIINTAYRFGVFDTCFIYRMNNPISVFPSKQTSSMPVFFNISIYNWAVKISWLRHESTHIGDELVIYRKDKDMPITRINALCNYAEIIFILNDPDSQARLNHGFKFGFLFNYNYFKNGWYSSLDTEADPDLIDPSQFPFEIYMQYQYQSPLFSKGFQIIGSAEYRLRERYKYPFSYSGSMKDSFLNDQPNLVNCFNFFAGIRYDNQKANYFSKIGIGAHYYFGINPYGQFRSMPYYSQLGLAVIFE